MGRGCGLNRTHVNRFRQPSPSKSRIGATSSTCRLDHGGSRGPRLSWDVRQEPRPTSETPRSRRFALPHLDDPRTDEAIDALLAGAERKRGRPAPEPLSITGRASFEGLESRMAWMDALRREDVRQQRYRHAASIVVFEARALTQTDTAGDWLGRIAGPVAHTIRRAARATDRVTRASETRFMVLLPETSEADAAHYAERVLSDCAIWLSAMHAPVSVRASAAAASAASEHSLEDALSRAIDALAGGLPTGMDDDDVDWELSRRPSN